MNRHLFMNRQALRAADRVAPRCRRARGQGVPRARRRRRAWPAMPRRIDVRRRASVWRAPCRLPARFYSPLPLRNYLPYGRELLDQGLEARRARRLRARGAGQPDRLDAVSPRHAAHARRGEAARARAAFERALALQPDLAEASNDLGALLAQGGDLAAAIERFRAALARDARLSRRAQQPRLRAAADGTRRRGARAVREGARAAARLPGGAQQPRVAARPRRRPRRAPSAISATALARRADYGEAANNLALVLVARRQADEAVALLEAGLPATPALRERLRDAGQDAPQRRPDAGKACGRSSACCSGIRRTGWRSNWCASGGRPLTAGPATGGASSTR